MSKRQCMPNNLLIIFFCIVAPCATAKARAGHDLRTARPLLAQSTLTSPQQLTQSKASQPSSASPQPIAPDASTPIASSPTPAAQSVIPGAGQAAAPAGAPGPAIGQGAVPAQGTPAAPGAVREKETKETKETKEIKDRPSDSVEFISAVAWPGTILLIIVFVFLLLACNRAIQQLFGIAASVVQKIEIAGVKLEIDTSAVEEVKKFIGGSLRELVEKAAAQYEKTVSATSVEDRLSQVVREGLQEILTRHNLNARPNAVRATIHVPDIVFKDYMYQLVNYYPRSASRSKTVGRRLSQRFGIVGRAWRSRRSIGRGKAISGPNAPDQLISFWGMQQDEADDQSHLVRPANLCVMLIDAQDYNSRVGLLYVDSTEANAFGINPLMLAPAPVREAAAAAALQAAETVAQAAADAAAQHTADPAGHAAAEAVARAANDAISQAANDATARAVNHEAAEATVFASARGAADLVAHAANDASAQAPNGVAAQAAAAAQAATDAVSRAVAQAVAQATAALPLGPTTTADEVAMALQDHPLTRALARAVNQAMAPLRGAGPALDVTDLRYE
ncbi:MAG: hypothetical protein JWP25_1176, partial [Bradyrhizobium sp.]|nr:hypothetical protein [Bradyrhizobium sp.]